MAQFHRHALSFLPLWTLWGYVGVLDISVESIFGQPQNERLTYKLVDMRAVKVELTLGCQREPSFRASRMRSAFAGSELRTTYWEHRNLVIYSAPFELRDFPTPKDASTLSRR